MKALILVILLLSTVFAAFGARAADSTAGYTDISGYYSKEGIHVVDGGGAYVLLFYSPYSYGCYRGNPWTGACSCPGGYFAWEAGAIANDDPYSAAVSRLYFCYKTAN